MPRIIERNAKDFRSQLSRHLQQLALDALPLAVDGLEIREPERGSIEETESDVEEASVDSLQDDPIPSFDIERGANSDALLQREQDGVADGPSIFNLMAAVGYGETIARQSSEGQAQQSSQNQASPEDHGTRFPYGLKEKQLHAE